MMDDMEYNYAKIIDDEGTVNGVAQMEPILRSVILRSRRTRTLNTFKVKSKKLFHKSTKLLNQKLDQPV